MEERERVHVAAAVNAHASARAGVRVAEPVLAVRRKKGARTGCGIARTGRAPVQGSDSRFHRVVEDDG